MNAAPQHVAVCSVGAAVDQRHHDGNGGEAFQPVAHLVTDHHVAKAVDGGPTAGVHRLQGSHNGQGHKGEHISSGAARTFHTQICQGNDAAHDEQDDFRINRNPTEFVDHFLSLNSIGANTD